MLWNQSDKNQWGEHSFKVKWEKSLHALLESFIICFHFFGTGSSLLSPTTRPPLKFLTFLALRLLGILPKESKETSYPVKAVVWARKLIKSGWKFSLSFSRKDMLCGSLLETKCWIENVVYSQMMDAMLLWAHATSWTKKVPHAIMIFIEIMKVSRQITDWCWRTTPCLSLTWKQVSGMLMLNGIGLTKTLISN